MTQELNDPLSDARDRIARCREQDDPEDLAKALETFAREALKQGQVECVAAALEEAGELWGKLQRVESQGSCLLLAASSYRLAMKPEDAARALQAGLAASLPVRLRRGFEMESCEQELANGRADLAWNCFTQLLHSAKSELEPVAQVQLLQRRAAAAVVGQRWSSAADDLLHASEILLRGGQHADAEACALAAAAVISEVDPNRAEQILTEVLSTVPAEGAAAARRGLVGGKVAMKAGNRDLALKRFDEARQGALDVQDPLSYFTAAVEASRAAETLGEQVTAYGRLATAWTTLSDLLGKESAGLMLRSELEGLRDRLGPESFAAAKRQYEADRKLDSANSTRAGGNPHRR